MALPLDLTDQILLVTGAASGIGAATARLALQLGAKVHLVDRSDSLASSDLARNPKASAHIVDVADRRAVTALVSTLEPLSALVHAAGICPFGDWLGDGFEDELDRVLATNLKSAIHLTRAILPGMMQRRSGRIVLVGSLAGRAGGLIAGPHYVASKGGLHALVYWLARRGGPSGVTVNGVAPASIATPMMDGQPVDLNRIPLGRMGTPEEVAWPILFYCSAQSSFITGTILDVNGGVYMG